MKIEVEVILYDQFLEQLEENKFLNFPVIDAPDAYYIQQPNGVEWQLLPTDIIVVFHDGSIATIPKDGATFIYI